MIARATIVLAFAAMLLISDRVVAGIVQCDALQSCPGGVR